MKLAISVSGNRLDAPFDARFGRAAAFCIVDTESGKWQIFNNPALSASGGAGVQAAQFIVRQGVQAVVSGAFGPNAFDTLEAAGVAMYLAPTDQSYSADEIVGKFKPGELSRVGAATHEGYHGANR